jgi:hypothetical protein
MNRKRARNWTAWLLPLLLLRSLIPLGFMPMVGAGHAFEIVLCDGYAPVAAASDAMPMDMSSGSAMDMHGDTGHAGAHQAHSTCLYGSSPALGAPLALDSSSAAPPPATAVPRRSPQLTYLAAPIRAQTARGPPV